MTQCRFAIGQLARKTGCKVQTIRYYEQINLLPAPERSAGNQRLYKQTHADRLVFIRHARALGFTLEVIRELLKLSDEPNQSCDTVDRMTRRHLAEVEYRITSLMALKEELQRMIEQCSGGRIADCRIIKVLADHSQSLLADPAQS